MSPQNAIYNATLSGASERPPVATGGTGSATFVVTGDLAVYTVMVTGLTAPVTLAHLLIGEREATAGLVIARLTLLAPAGTVATGTIDLGRPVTFNNTTISGDSLRRLLDRGATYVNVYTATFPGGEVRGQVLPR